jgi:hypothetical protein
MQGYYIGIGTFLFQADYVIIINFVIVIDMGNIALSTAIHDRQIWEFLVPFYVILV